MSDKYVDNCDQKFNWPGLRELIEIENKDFFKKIKKPEEEYNEAYSLEILILQKAVNSFLRVEKLRRKVQTKLTKPGSST